jgi:hypothetical protein
VHCEHRIARGSAHELQEPHELHNLQDLRRLKVRRRTQASSRRLPPPLVRWHTDGGNVSQRT